MIHVGPENIEPGGNHLVGELKTAKDLGLISGKYQFDADAIVYSKIRPNLNKVCVPRFSGVCSADMYPLWPDTARVDRDYLCQYMRSPQFVSEAVLSSMRTGMPKINRPDLERIKIVLPPLSEQRRIAKTLQTWDEAIEKIGRLTAAKESVRDRLQRAHGAWDRWPLRAIGEIVSPISRPQPTPSTAYTALGIRSHGKGTFQRQIDRPEEIDMDTVYVVGERDLIVNITFAWEGAIALAKPEDAGRFVSHRFPTFEIDQKQVNRNYLGYAVRSPRFIRDLGIASPGGAGRNRVLNKTDFLKIKIPFPPKDRQDLIAKALDSADQEIALLSRQRDALVKQKRGLMQKLLTGEWPVSASKSREAAE
jgi:type I restriction enzyme S subunit